MENKEKLMSRQKARKMMFEVGESKKIPSSRKTHREIQRKGRVRGKKGGKVLRVLAL